MIMQHASRVRHLHVHDFDGKSDHLALGTGVVDLTETLAFARAHDLTIVVETKTVDALHQSCRWLMEKLKPTRNRTSDYRIGIMRELIVRKGGCYGSW